jgi:hypothetical protein
MVNWKNLDLEFDEHAFKHGIKDYEIEQIFKGKIYKRKIYVNKELRYQIIGEAFGRLIMIIAVPSGRAVGSKYSVRGRLPNTKRYMITKRSDYYEIQEI